MKIREGFVTNSSSTSFMITNKTDRSISARCIIDKYYHDTLDKLMSDDDFFTNLCWIVGADNFGQSLDNIFCEGIKYYDYQHIRACRECMSNIKKRYLELLIKELEYEPDRYKIYKPGITDTELYDHGTIVDAFLYSMFKHAVIDDDQLIISDTGIYCM